MIAAQWVFLLVICCATSDEDGRWTTAGMGYKLASYRVPSRLPTWISRQT